MRLDGYVRVSRVGGRSGDAFISPGEQKEKVRAWANRDLGHSIILYTVAEKTSGFQFVISDDQDWIIIENDKDQSCFFDRGTDMVLRFNTTLINP